MNNILLLFLPLREIILFWWNQAALWTVSVFRHSSTRPWLLPRLLCCRLRRLPLAGVTSLFWKSCRSAASIKIMTFSTVAGGQFPSLITSQYDQYDKNIQLHTNRNRTQTLDNHPLCISRHKNLTIYRQTKLPACVLLLLATPQTDRWITSCFPLPD